MIEIRFVTFSPVPPKRIEFVGQRSGSRMEKRENEKVEVSCKVSNAKPAAEVAWFRNNVPFNPGKGTAS